MLSTCLSGHIGSSADLGWAHLNEMGELAVNSSRLVLAGMTWMTQSRCMFPYLPEVYPKHMFMMKHKKEQESPVTQELFKSLFVSHWLISFWPKAVTQLNTEPKGQARCFTQSEELLQSHTARLVMCLSRGDEWESTLKSTTFQHLQG